MGSAWAQNFPKFHRLCGDINYGNPRNNTWIPCNFNFITYIEIIVSSHTYCGVQWRQFFFNFCPCARVRLIVKLFSPSLEKLENPIKVMF